jgi:hypothetical protein
MNDTLFGKEVISSVCNSDEECLSNILTLIGKKSFDLDPTYSKGNFYKNIPQPKHKFDLTPESTESLRADCRNIPLPSNSLESIVFDPPFMFEKRHRENINIMKQRFSMFHGGFEELEEMYKSSLKEFHRLLQKGGHLIFKCQDYTDSKTTMTHCLVYNWAIEQGFYAQDLFILVFPSGRIYNPNLTQRHARKFHSYYWLFNKITQG